MKSGTFPMSIDVKSSSLIALTIFTGLPLTLPQAPNKKNIFVHGVCNFNEIAFMIRSECACKCCRSPYQYVCSADISFTSKNGIENIGLLKDENWLSYLMWISTYFTILRCNVLIILSYSSLRFFR